MIQAEGVSCGLRQGTWKKGSTFGSKQSSTLWFGEGCWALFPGDIFQYFHVLKGTCSWIHLFLWPCRSGEGACIQLTAVRLDLYFWKVQVGEFLSWHVCWDLSLRAVFGDYFAGKYMRVCFLFWNILFLNCLGESFWSYYRLDLQIFPFPSFRLIDFSHLIC